MNLVLPYNLQFSNTRSDISNFSFNNIKVTLVKFDYFTYINFNSITLNL